MRILWVKTELLHPIDKGGKIRTFQMLRSLLREHEITYLCLDDGSASSEDRANAGQYCTQLVAIPFHPTTKGSVGFFLDLVRNLASSLPYSVARYRSEDLLQKTHELAPQHDVVVCDFLFTSYAAPDGSSSLNVLFQHNVEAQIWARRADVAGGILRRAYMRTQYHRMRQYERAECLRLDHVVAVSSADAEQFRKDYGVTSVSDVPTGVDLDYFSGGEFPRRDAELVFVGSMDWMPNEDAVCWFSEEVWWRVRERQRAARLVVVGRSPSEAVRRLVVQYPGIEVTGTVSDVRPYLQRGSVFVVPLRVGGGTRLKIYEAMAMGIPVVSTSIGAEGLPVINETHLLIADTPEEQAAAILRLLEDPVAASTMARAALEWVRAHGGWDAVAGGFIEQCRAAAVERFAARGAR